MSEKILREIDYKVYYNEKNKQVIGYIQGSVAAIYVSDLDRKLPKLEKSVRGIVARRAKLIIYKGGIK